MSAESPNAARFQKTAKGPAIVLPQEVNDLTILESVAGFINDVVPTNHSEPVDTRDRIQWVRFEQVDSKETSWFDCDSDTAVPLLIILGYSSGIQVWAVLTNGEAVEILSWRHGTVRVLKVLPTPHIAGRQITDIFLSKRPLVALCDSTVSSIQSNSHCSLRFLSLKTDEQVHLMKFKNSILNVLANKRSVVVTFVERIAVFDAFTLDSRFTITNCYISPGIQQNPIALGSRWLAYAATQLNTSKKSQGGFDGNGIQSYTATVLHAAKSLGRGLREFGETVASSLTGNPQQKLGASPGSPLATGQSDTPQKGIVTILDPECHSSDETETTLNEAVKAHFVAHHEALVYLLFDPSGSLLLTADKRGHCFHLFKIHTHPAGSSFASVHHLYILYRGDTSAKVQDMCFSWDSRWVTVSSIRGTTHVFPVTPYGGSVGVRTHMTPYVVNKMSRFKRSAGLTFEGTRSNSPIPQNEAPVNMHLAYHNPRYPPYPCATIVQRLCQIRPLVCTQAMGTVPHRGLSALAATEETQSLRLAACFAPSRAWLERRPSVRDTGTYKQARPVDALFIVSCQGTLVQYHLEPKPIASVPKERVCDETPVDLQVTARAQWQLQRRADTEDVSLPMSPTHLQYITQQSGLPTERRSPLRDTNTEQWMSQVEIVTHAGPHRRLWMGPQFVFKTYEIANGSTEIRPIDVDRSKPINMAVLKSNNVTLIESGSAGSYEPPSPQDAYHTLSSSGIGDNKLRADLADAMQEPTKEIYSRQSMSDKDDSSTSSCSPSPSSENLLHFQVDSSGPS